ncbi:MAG: HIT family protein, partial [Gammaproteobacteria bacterium]
AFMDIQPITPGHTLVVPLVKAATLAELPPATGARMFTVAQRIGAAIRRTELACEGVNLFLADGAAAGQTVFHLHLHVFPRHADDGFRWKLPDSYYTPPPRAEIERAGAAIRAALAPD